MNRIYYYKTLRMTLITFIAAPAMIATSLYVTTIPFGIITQVIGYVGAAFFGVCFIIGLYNYLRGTFRREALIITPSTFTVNTPSQGSYTLAWNDIKETHTVDVAAERFLAIMLHDPQSFIEQQGSSAIARRMMEADMACVGSPCTVAMSNIDAGDDDIELIIKQHIAQYGRSAATKNGPTQD